MTQCERLEKWLLEYGEIDPLTAWAELGVHRPGARIHDLRRQEVNVVSLRRKARKGARNRFGEACEVVLYRIEKAVGRF